MVGLFLVILSMFLFSHGTILFPKWFFGHLPRTTNKKQRNKETKKSKCAVWHLCLDLLEICDTNSEDWIRLQSSWLFAWSYNHKPQNYFCSLLSFICASNIISNLMVYGVLTWPLGSSCLQYMHIYVLLWVKIPIKTFTEKKYFNQNSFAENRIWLLLFRYF